MNRAQNSPATSGGQEIRLRADEQPVSREPGKKKLARFSGKHTTKSVKKSSRR